MNWLKVQFPIHIGYLALTYTYLYMYSFFPPCTIRFIRQRRAGSLYLRTYSFNLNWMFLAPLSSISLYHALLYVFLRGWHICILRVVYTNVTRSSSWSKVVWGEPAKEYYSIQSSVAVVTKYYSIYSHRSCYDGMLPYIFAAEKHDCIKKLWLPSFSQLVCICHQDFFLIHVKVHEFEGYRSNNYSSVLLKIWFSYWCSALI